MNTLKTNLQKIYYIYILFCTYTNKYKTNNFNTPLEILNKYLVYYVLIKPQYCLKSQIGVLGYFISK